MSDPSRASTASSVGNSMASGRAVAPPAALGYLRDAMDVILVTGGAGFIGSNFVRLALERTGARVVVLDKLTYAGNLASLRDVAAHPRFAFVRGDIADRVTVEAVFREHRPTQGVNFAAESPVDRPIDGAR